MIEHAAAAKAELWRAPQKILEVGTGGNIVRWIRRCIRKKQLAVEYLREKLVQIDTRILPSKTEDMRSFDPAHGVHKIVVILRLRLICRRRGTDLKTRTSEDEFVNRSRDIVG